MRNAIDWSKLTHAYGAATDVPGLLLRLRTAPADASFKEEPWFSLWRALCAQGAVYPASFAALPELVDIAVDREPAAAVDCLYLAATIELQRHNVTAPLIPVALRDVYGQGVKEMQAVARRLPTTDLANVHRARLNIVLAVAEGRLVEARRLVDAD